jgi:hypothetical protein
MRCVKTGVSLIFLLLLAAQAATANVIVVEGDGNPSYLTFVGDAPQGISAFGVEIRYPNGTHVTGVESVEPFEVVSGIDVVNGTVKIGGYTSQCSQAAVNDRLQLAEVWLTDTVEGVVIVDYLEDSQRNPIRFQIRSAHHPRRSKPRFRRMYPRLPTVRRERRRQVRHRQVLSLFLRR